jgi:hypothetical protein
MADSVAYFAKLGIRIDRVMTDNGSSPNLHQTLHAEDQRQGRALHPNRAARMGLRPCLPKLGSTIC